MANEKAPWNKNADYPVIIAGCLFAIALILVVAMLGGWLVTIVLGYFGIHFTLWQGMVTAFTISMLTGNSYSSRR